MNTDQEFLSFVVKSLVDNPDDVQIDRKVDEMGVLLTLSINPADMGKIIGRQGNTAKAIRTLLRVIGMKNNSRVNLKISEPEGGQKPFSSDSSEEAPAPAMNVAADVDAAMEDLKNI